MLKQAEPKLQYGIFDEQAAESIQKVASIAKEDMVDYITISAHMAETAVELMKFYVDTKKLLYGFPLVTVPPSDRINVGPSVSQQMMKNQDDIQRRDTFNVDSLSNQSVVSGSSLFSRLSSTSDGIDHSILHAITEKILFYKHRIVSSSRVAQLVRVSDQIIPISTSELY